jgi:hypothetical protein
VKAEETLQGILALRRTVQVRLEARRLELDAFHVRILALNAMIASIHAGRSAAGFGAAAAHLRQLSGELEEAVGALADRSHHAVKAAAETSKLERRHRLLARAGLHAEDRGSYTRTLARAHDELLDQVAEMQRLSTVGYVVSRSTMIEAAYCDLRPNPLEDVAKALAERVNAMAESLQGLVRATHA